MADRRSSSGGTFMHALVNGMSFVGLVLLSGCQHSIDYADAVYRNGSIYTMDPAQPWVESLAVRDGKLVHAGTNHAADRLVGPATQIVDLDSRFVMPGIHDAHIHTQMAAEFQQNLSTDPDRPWAEIARDIADFASSNPDKRWILGGNLPWLTDVIGDNADVPAHRTTMDKLVPNQAIALWDVGGHAMLANSRALELVGITDATPDPVGGTIERDENGRATGVLRELAANLITENADALSVEQYADGLETVIAQLSSLGITTFHEVWTYPDTLRALKLMSDQERLNARVVVAIAHPVEFVTERAKAAASELIEQHADYESDRVQVRYVKFVLDGSAGGQTLVLVDPYEGTSFRGKLRNPADVVMREVTRLEGLGLGSVLHAVGDGAVRLALDAVQQSRQDNPDSGVRQVIGHSVFVNPEDLPRFKALGVIAEFSPFFWQPSDGAEILRHELGEHRLNWAFPMRRIIDDGNPVSAGSDWPVVFDPNPFPGMETMITREKPGGSAESFGKEHAITLEEAIAMFTMGGAFEHYLEDTTGSLTVGKFADFIVLDQNLFEVPVHHIHKTRVLRTVLEGEVIHEVSP